MAVVAGASGARLGPRVALILGVANLNGDGVSMGASNYLGLKSELEQAGGDVAQEAPWRHGLATVAAFVVVGTVPLTAYALPLPSGVSVLLAAAVLSLAVLAATGAVRARFVGRGPFQERGGDGGGRGAGGAGGLRRGHPGSALHLRLRASTWWHEVGRRNEHASQRARV